MASSKLSLSLFVLSCAFLLLSSPVHCSIAKDLIEDLKEYRESQQLPILTKNDKAACLAGEIADDLDDNQPCSKADDFTNDPASSVPKAVDYDKHLKTCQIDRNTTKDGIILPVCTPKLVGNLFYNTYNSSAYKKYFNDSNYTGVGVGSEDEWIVVVLSTDKQTGSFSGAVSLLAFGMVQYCSVMVLLFFGLFFTILY
ncbi:hypothetical protein UlMin_029267 [Ulmus minor]